MIDRQHNKIVFECDACGETLDTGESEFDEANLMRLEEGWLAYKTGRDWSHYCSQRCADAA